MDVEHVGLLSFISSSVSLRFDGNWLPVTWFHLPWVAHIPRFAYHKLDCHRGLEACRSPSFSNIWLMTMMRNTVGGFRSSHPAITHRLLVIVVGHGCLWTLTLPRFAHLRIWLTLCDRYLSFYIPCNYLLDDLVRVPVCVCLSWLDTTRWLTDNIPSLALGVSSYALGRFIVY